MNNIAKDVIRRRVSELKKEYETNKERVIGDLIETGRAQTRTAEIADLFRNNNCFTIRDFQYLGKKIFEINIVSLNIDDGASDRDN